MSTEDNKNTVRRFFEEAGNLGRIEVLHELFTDDYGADAGHGPVGPARALHGLQHVRAAFPDVQFTVDELIAEGDTVVVRVTHTGTHRGEYAGIPATGKRVTLSGVEAARMRGGRIAAMGWHVTDLTPLLRAAGILPE
jgi:predicted ester cyclase